MNQSKKAMKSNDLPSPNRPLGSPADEGTCTTDTSAPEPIAANDSSHFATFGTKQTTKTAEIDKKNWTWPTWTAAWLLLIAITFHAYMLVNVGRVSTRTKPHQIRKHDDQSNPTPDSDWCFEQKSTASVKWHPCLTANWSFIKWDPASYPAMEAFVMTEMVQSHNPVSVRLPLGRQFARAWERPAALNTLLNTKGARSAAGTRAANNSGIIIWHFLAAMSAWR